MKVALVADKKRIDLSVQLKKNPRSQAYNSFLCLVDELCEQWPNRQCDNPRMLDKRTNRTSVANVPKR